MKILLTDCGSTSQQILTIKVVLKNLVFSAENDHNDVITMKKYSPIIVDLLSKINNINNVNVTSDIFARRRIKARHWSISKSGLDCSIDQEAFSYS